MIPSPPSPDALVISPVPVLGQISIPWYGVGYAVALVLGAWLTARLARRRGLDATQIGDGILWVIAFGIIGARLYHVIDQWALYKDDLLKIVLPPYSGLALYGGVLGGLFGLFVAARRRHQPFLRWVDTVVPAFFFGQAIARWGNFANQELYGPPTTLPWGIVIDCTHRVTSPGVVPFPCQLYPLGTGFHPLFLYESILTFLGGVAALLLITRASSWLRDGDLLALWLIWYGVVRTVLETFRLSYDFTFFGIPVAMLFGLGASAVGAVLLIVNHRRATPSPSPSSEPPADRSRDAAPST